VCFRLQTVAAAAAAAAAAAEEPAAKRGKRKAGDAGKEKQPAATSDVADEGAVPPPAGGAGILLPPPPMPASEEEEEAEEQRMAELEEGSTEGMGVLEWVATNGARCEWSHPAKKGLVRVSSGGLRDATELVGNMEVTGPSRMGLEMLLEMGDGGGGVGAAAGAAGGAVWAALDLGLHVQLTHYRLALTLELRRHQRCVTGAGVEWSLEVSLDGTQWRTVHEGALNEGEPAGALFELDAAAAAAALPVRFLRLHTRGAAGMRRQSHFAELELYGAVLGGVKEPLRALGPPPRWAASGAAAAAAGAAGAAGARSGARTAATHERRPTAAATAATLRQRLEVEEEADEDGELDAEEEEAMAMDHYYDLGAYGGAALFGGDDEMDDDEMDDEEMDAAHRRAEEAEAADVAALREAERLDAAIHAVRTEVRSRARRGGVGAAAAAAAGPSGERAGVGAASSASHARVLRSDRHRPAAAAAAEEEGGAEGDDGEGRHARRRVGGVAGAAGAAAAAHAAAGARVRRARRAGGMDGGLELERLLGADLPPAVTRLLQARSMGGGGGGVVRIDGMMGEEEEEESDGEDEASAVEFDWEGGGMHVERAALPLGRRAVVVTSGGAGGAAPVLLEAGGASPLSPTRPALHPRWTPTCTALSLIPTVTGNTVRSFCYARATVRSPRKLNHCLTI
jgi:hypothetical protein